MKVKLNNVGVIKNCEIEFIPGINLIVGSSGSGKSTLMRSIYNTACNNFSDCDISFGEDSMDIAIENNGNLIEYNRNTRPRCEHCYYKVNGETYVKLGRQALPAVTNSLKIGDICINGDDINFNFNLQFSTPFLIMGSQSTLYNVLTYRSTCDITSINEYYESDVKLNASEISSNIKVKERLVESLETLISDAEQLKPIEELYSEFVSYKHENEKLTELNEYYDRQHTHAELSNILASIDEAVDTINSALSELSILIDLHKYYQCETDKSRLMSAIESMNEFETSYSMIVGDFSIWSTIRRLDNMLLEDEMISARCTFINSLINSSSALLSNESFTRDIARLHSLYNSFERCSNKYDLLNTVNCDIVSMIDDFVIADRKIHEINKINNSISNVSKQYNNVSEELNKFEICPLCGKHLNTL